MGFRDRSLQIDETADGGRTWTVFTDLALALLLVLVLFILAQFLELQQIAVFDEIDARRSEVAAVIGQAARRAPISTEQARQLTIENTGSTTQRVTFPEPMLFAPCGTDPQPEGQDLIREIGRVLNRRASYFEAVQIEGHADRAPPTGPCLLAVRDNWGLSSMRATAFLRILVASDIFSRAEIVSAVGRGDTRPLSNPNAGPEQWDQDRRIELVLVYDEADAEAAVRAQ